MGTAVGETAAGPPAAGDARAARRRAGVFYTPSPLARQIVGKVVDLGLSRALHVVGHQSGLV